MRICIVGAGSIGGFIGARLAATGQHTVTALARGATLAALRTHGWRVRSGGVLQQWPARAESDPAAIGPQDLVLIAVKGQALPALAPTLGPLLTPQTWIVPAMNGVPWWFCEGRTEAGDGPLESVDPGGGIAATLPLEGVLGCVVHLSCSSPEPGLVDHRIGNGLIVGEARGGRSPRAEALGALLAEAGFEASVSSDVRTDIWYKLWGNLTMNPASALTGATIDRLLNDPLVRAFCTRAMEEAAALGARIGCPIAQTAEDRHAITARLGAFRTSMLQDVEAGRTIELDAIVGSVCEIGRRCGIATPSIDALLGLTRVFAQVRGLYPDPTHPDPRRPAP